MVLSDIQVRAAQICLEARPEVIPGTNVVIHEAAKTVWYNQVHDAMKAVDIKTAQEVHDFCNLAGVPD